jgi:hypothetical protein
VVARYLLRVSTLVVLLGLWLLMVPLRSPLLVGSGSAAPPPPPCGERSPVALNPTAGPAGSQVTATGCGWTPGSQITVTWDNPQTTLATTTVDTGGGFTVSFTVPADAPPGNHQVLFTQSCAGCVSRQETALFKVTGGTATATPTPTPTNTESGTNQRHLTAAPPATFISMTSPPAGPPSDVYSPRWSGAPSARRHSPGWCPAPCPASPVGAPADSLLRDSEEPTRYLSLTEWDGHDELARAMRWMTWLNCGTTLPWTQGPVRVYDEVGDSVGKTLDPERVYTHRSRARARLSCAARR